MDGLVRITKWGKAHAPGKTERLTLCGLRIERALEPKERRGLCVQCRKLLDKEEAEAA